MRLRPGLSAGVVHSAPSDPLAGLRGAAAERGRQAGWNGEERTEREGKEGSEERVKGWRREGRIGLCRLCRKKFQLVGLGLLERNPTRTKP